MRVWLHPDKMIAYGLSTDVSDALEDQNIEVSPGKLREWRTTSASQRVCLSIQVTQQSDECKNTHHQEQ